MAKKLGEVRLIRHNDNFYVDTVAEERSNEWTIIMIRCRSDGTFSYTFQRMSLSIEISITITPFTLFLRSIHLSVLLIEEEKPTAWEYLSTMKRDP